MHISGHRHKWLALLLFGIFFLLAQPAKTQEASDKVSSVGTHAALLSIKGAIGPATHDYLSRAMAQASAKGASLFVIKMDTPGGLDAATRDIIQAILASDIPVVTYVSPAGSRAASAGTYILYASHIAAMTPSTTLGAATPVSLSGGGESDDGPGLPFMPGKDKGESRDKSVDEDATSPESKESEKTKAPLSGSAMERKVLNDSIAYIRGLAKRHGRNEAWAEEAVRSAATLTATEALEQNVIDIVAEDMSDLLQQIDGLEVRMENGQATIKSAGIATVSYEPDWRSQLLAAITNPQIAYLLLMIGIYGLILEGYNPGALVPGIVGAISLLIASYALQVLPVNYVGLSLIALGVLLIVAETMAPSFGILGIGGVVATTLGSIMLIDSDVPGIEISKPLIGGVAAASSLIVLFVLLAVGKSLRIKSRVVNQEMVGRTGKITDFNQSEGMMLISGELWEALSDEELHVEDTVRVLEQNGLTLKVTKI